MKILMITEKDAANASLARIADAFIARGHEVTVYAPYYSSSVLMFFNEQIGKHPLSELTLEKAKQFDVVFTATVSVAYLNREDLLSLSKPIFTHNYLIDKQVSWGGDICFVPSYRTVASKYDKYLNYSRVGIGEPKYDSKCDKRKDNKRFLFIDTNVFANSCFPTFENG